ncbi:glycoside hydrolase family protein [Sphingomonas sp. MM-1]|uniref:glycoside hydrolase family 19 protein n=1 Tax=Sphingomonas sp. MM-1 TaxID=745310 RepID=UPI0002C0A8AF|nr:glycoside hydrolase family 19 protein [Sphingomonas sp. MM-1]AGH48779.1 glycoside hydrolase family protein [Sphingomonas sp. MM-1]
MIDWKRAQQRLGVAADGVPGPITMTALLAFVAGRAADDAIRAMGAMLAKQAAGYGMTTPERLAEFVAQICNETGGFRRFVENLNYSAEAIQRTWPSRFPTLASAAPFARNPEKLANRVYDRASEGNTQPGDGWRYRGRGALQLTFRGNYRRFGQALGLPLEDAPDLAANPATSVLIALHFWRLGKVNDAVDAHDYRRARRIANGGYIGLEEVARLRVRALGVLA